MSRYYFDHNATTPVSWEVLAAYLPALMEVSGNPSSVHGEGQQARKFLESARQQVASLLACPARDVIFTSGGTESNNLAVLGAVRAAPMPRKHVITTAIEHPCVLHACQQLQQEGVEISYAAVGPDGVVDPAAIRALLRPETVLISVMHANNEIGTIQPLAEIARIARAAGVLLHADGVQAAGRIPVRVDELGVDLYAISGHKMYAPKGCGALFVRSGVALQPLMFGGPHERRLRPGTENVASAAALGRAAQWVMDHLGQEASRLQQLRDRLEEGILRRVPRARINGSRWARLPNTSNICFEGVEGEALVIALDLRGFAVSTGAACSSGAVAPSHVLTAIGCCKEDARASIRFSLGRTTTAAQVDALIEAVVEVTAHLRRLSPAYV